MSATMLDNNYNEVVNCQVYRKNKLRFFISKWSCKDITVVTRFYKILLLKLFGKEKTIHNLYSFKLFILFNIFW